MIGLGHENGRRLYELVSKTFTEFLTLFTNSFHILWYYKLADAYFSKFKKLYLVYLFLTLFLIHVN